MKETHAGLGCPGGPLASAYALLEMGSPRLALAKARGIPFAPYVINVRGTFPDTTTALVPSTGAEGGQVSQDTIIDSLVVRTLNLSTTANQNTFQPQSDFYFGIQSGIQATLDVQGAPRYAVTRSFTPLSSIADMIGPSFYPRGWILTYQQQLFMSFESLIVLPFAPIQVVCSFRAWTPVVDAYGGAELTNVEAMDKLQTEFGIVISEAYRNRPGR